jgi:hypothetical protein
LSQIQAAIANQSSATRPWQRYEPLSRYLDPGLWPSDDIVLQDLTFAKLAIQLLTETQRNDLEVTVSE